MKIKLMIVVLAMLFSTGLQSMADDCTHRDGTTGTKIPITFTASNGCIYTVQLCVTCSVVAHIFKVDIGDISWDNTICPAPSSSIRQEIAEYVMSEAGFREYCGSPVPPCNEGVLTLYGSMSSCHMVEFTSETEWQTVPCGSAYCYFFHTMCWDGEKYVYSPMVKSQVGTPDCPSIVDESDPPLDGSCYRTWTPCDEE